MPAYSFKKRFVPPVLSGAKTKTIRRRSKKTAKPGDRLYLYFGLRTKWCEKLGEANCTKVEEIIIDDFGVFIKGVKVVKPVELKELAVSDGFESFEDMMRFWREEHMIPFLGDIIYWDELITDPAQWKNGSIQFPAGVI
jgi:hypothetical protein